nr:hybrid signal transduction histidine kinase M [Tanacetum cinerariifolium]
MTATSTTSIILLLDKIMTITNLTTLVPVKLEIDEMNYSSWVYFFKNLCKSHEILKHILGEPTDEATSSNPSPPTAEWLKIDSIVLSWIFMTLSKTLQQRLVVKDPQKAKEAWDLIALIFNDNKRTQSIALKAELRSLKLGDLSIDTYFHKIKPIDTIFTSLGSPISNDDAVSIVLEGLPDKCDNVISIIVHREPFLDLKMVHFMLTTKEMWLKSRAQASPIDSTFYLPLILLANGGNSTRRPKVALEKALIQMQQALLAKLGYNDNNNIGHLLANTHVSNPTGNTTHVALHTSLSHNSHGFAQSYATYHSPPGFSFLQQATQQSSPQSCPFHPAQHAKYYQPSEPASLGSGHPVVLGSGQPI